MIAEFVDLGLKAIVASFGMFYVVRSLESERRLSALEAKTSATLDAIGRELSRLSDALDNLRESRGR